MFEVLSRKKSPEELVELMREVGRQLARTYPRSHGTVRERMTRASQLLRELGGLTEVIEEEGKVVILGHGCPLAAATRTHPEACNIIESLLSQVVGEPVSKCCDRYARERCCFEIAAGAA
jgi:predicted ArsR family transcriptional regulator